MKIRVCLLLANQKKRVVVSKRKNFLIYITINPLFLCHVCLITGNFVPFAMGSGGNRSSDHGIGNKTPASPSTAINVSTQQTNQNKKKGRIDVKDVFNNDDDDDGANNAKKRKLVPLGNCKY